MSREASQPKPHLTAFISGPLDVSNAYFTRYYRSRIDEAISSEHHFVVGPVSGIDAIALDYLLSRSVPSSHIHIYMAGFEIDTRHEFVKKMREQLGSDAVVEARRQDGEDARTTWDRDAAMTRASDYDILRFRTEWESRALYGDRWMPRVSNTERNLRRRQGAAAEERSIEYISHMTLPELRMKAVKQWSNVQSDVHASDDTDCAVCDGTCDGHRDVAYFPLLLHKAPFGSGNDGERSC